MSRPSMLERIELTTYDLRLAARDPLPSSPAIALALIDERSLDEEGRWPWPRSRMAALVDVLSGDGARVIAFDVGFLEPDENSELQLVRRLGREIEALGVRNSALSDFVTASEQRADNDLALATAVRRSSAAVVLGYFFHESEAALTYRIDPADIEARLARIDPSKYPLVRYREPPGDTSPFIPAYAPETNLQVLSDAAASAGYFSFQGDEDGVIRWAPLALECGEEVFPPLAVSAAWQYLGKPRLAVEVGRYGVEGVRLGDRLIPTDPRGRLLINYLGPPRTFPYFSISDILRGAVPAGTFKDRIVIVGATAMGTHDLRSVPVSPVYPGVEIHATVADNVLTQRYLTRPGWSAIYDLAAIVALATLIGLGLPRMRAVVGLVFFAALFATHVLVAGWIFGRAGVWLNVVYPLVALTTNYTALTAHYYLTEERERRKVREAFGHYVAPSVIEDMLRDPGRLQLGGEEKVLTVLFSDLAGFTSVSERYGPSEIRAILSDYYDRMTKQLFDHEGTLIEYVGDELIALFGAPSDQADHARRACAAALAMREDRAALRAEWERIGRPPLSARTGINSGPMLVGNLGSRYRFTYSMLGDQVNLASRLEGLNKEYDTEILLGEGTAQLIDGTFRLREVDMVRVKGRRQPVRIYELLARADTPLGPEMEAALDAYAAGLEAYRGQRWEAALELFRRCASLAGDDGPSRRMIERCQIFERTPPESDWDGVFEQTRKG